MPWGHQHGGKPFPKYLLEKVFSFGKYLFQKIQNLLFKNSVGTVLPHEQRDAVVAEAARAAARGGGDVGALGRREGALAPVVVPDRHLYGGSSPRMITGVSTAQEQVEVVRNPFR